MIIFSHAVPSRFDEFGFNHQGEEPTPGSSKEVEDSAHKFVFDCPCLPKEIASRMKFISLLEHSHSEGKMDLKWSQVDVEKIKGEKLEELVKYGGIPHSMRPYMWFRLSGGLRKKKESQYSYEDVLKQSALDKPSIGTIILEDFNFQLFQVSK